jgi:hypothetical protein
MKRPLLLVASIAQAALAEVLDRRRVPAVGQVRGDATPLKCRGPRRRAYASNGQKPQEGRYGDPVGVAEDRSLLIDPTAFWADHGRSVLIGLTHGDDELSIGGPESSLYTLKNRS